MNGRTITINDKEIFIEFGKDISKQILEQLKEPKKVEIKKVEKKETKKKRGK
jgi:hypothetical protein